LRYPSDFFIDVIFNNDKNIQSNNFEEDVVKFKNIISDFIVKGYKNNVITGTAPDDATEFRLLNKPVPLISEPLEQSIESKIRDNNKLHVSSIDKVDSSRSNKNDINNKEEKINSKDNKDNIVGNNYKSESLSSKDNHRLEMNLEHEEEEAEEEELHATTNTLEQANEILQKFNQGKKEKNKAKDIHEDDDDDEDEEDLDDYIKNLENKA